jgi:hypothetical protein
LSNPEVLGQITWLRQRMPHVPLVLLMEHDDLDEIVEAMAQGVRGFITTSMELSEVGLRSNASPPAAPSCRPVPGQVRPGSAKAIG